MYDGCQSCVHRTSLQNPPDARLLSVASRALDHAVDSAIDGQVFLPFLTWQDEIGWHVFRYMVATVGEAEVTARAHVRRLPPSVAACAFVYDGYTTVDDQRVDAAFCRVSHRDPAIGIVVIQPYIPTERGGTALGKLLIDASVESWFRR